MNSLVRIVSPTRASSATAKSTTSTTTGKTTKSTTAAASGRPAASARPSANEWAAKTRITVTAAAAHSSNNDECDNENEKEDDETELSVLLRTAFPNCVAGAFVLAANRFHDQIDSFGETTLVVSISKMRLDVILGDV